MSENDKVKKYLLAPIRTTWGTYNRICPNCYARYGHQLIWCERCTNKLMTYKSFKKILTNGEWILGATTEMERKHRFGVFLIQYHLIIDIGIQVFNKQFEKSKITVRDIFSKIGVELK